MRLTQSNQNRTMRPVLIIICILLVVGWMLYPPVGGSGQQVKKVDAVQNKLPDRNQILVDSFFRMDSTIHYKLCRLRKQ